MGLPAERLAIEGIGKCLNCDNSLHATKHRIKNRSYETRNKKTIIKKNRDQLFFLSHTLYLNPYYHNMIKEAQMIQQVPKPGAYILWNLKSTHF